MKLKVYYIVFTCLMGINSSAYGSQIIFDSGTGGPYKHWAYQNYYSDIIFTPFTNMIVSGIDPDIFSCQGDCSYGVKIADSKGNILGEAYEESMYFDQISLNDILLLANHDYRIYELAKSTESFGIRTASSDSLGINLNGKFELMIAYKRTYWLESFRTEYSDRGPISFKLYGELTPVPLPSSFILLGSCLAGLVALKRKRPGHTISG